VLSTAVQASISGSSRSERGDGSRLEPDDDMPSARGVGPKGYILPAKQRWAIASFFRVRQTTSRAATHPTPLQRALPDGALRIVARGEKKDVGVLV